MQVRQSEAAVHVSGRSLQPCLGQETGSVEGELWQRQTHDSQGRAVECQIQYHGVGYEFRLEGIRGIGMKDTPYFKQAQLMLRVLPHVAAEECFALKGGKQKNVSR